MPLYEYVCESCGQRFDKMVRFSEHDLRPVCPTCGATHTHKAISLFASRSTGGSPTVSASSCASSGSPFR